MPKRKHNVRRHPSGKIVQAAQAVDRGTPELQAMRAAAGIDGPTVQLSHGTPVDILTARGYLTADLRDAAIDYIRAHELVYGRTHARAIRLGQATGGEPPTHARLRAERQLDAWTHHVRRHGRYAVMALSRYVIDEYPDALIRAVRDGLPVDAELWPLHGVRIALTAIWTTPRVHVLEDAIERAQRQEAAERDAAAVRFWSSLRATRRAAA